MALFNTLDQVDCQYRQAIYRALLLVIARNFLSSENVLAAKKRLQCLVDGNDPTKNNTVVPKIPKETNARSLKREPEGSFGSDKQRYARILPRTEAKKGLEWNRERHLRNCF